MGSPSTKFGQKMQADQYARSRAALEEDLASPGLWGVLPFGGVLERMNADSSRQELEWDQRSPGSLWGLF